MATQEKLDLFKLHREQYQQPKQPVLLNVPKARYLAIEGRGRPGGDEFQACIGALFAAAYTLKFAHKAKGRDFVVCKLECVYGSDGTDDFAQLPPELWPWQLLIRMPSFVQRRALAAAVAMLRDKGHPGPIDALQLVDLKEGRCVQMLHVGPYDQECATIARMREFAAAQGRQLAGRHHEIYLSDPRCVAPNKLKTILRQPVQLTDAADGRR